LSDDQSFPGCDLMYVPENKQFSLSCAELDIPSSGWVNNSVIASSVDLPCSQVVLSFKSQFAPSDAMLGDLQRVRRGLRLQKLDVKLPRGHIISLNRTDWHEFTQPTGLRAYDRVLPSDLAVLQWPGSNMQAVHPDECGHSKEPT
jgi:hypothetical protein